MKQLDEKLSVLCANAQYENTCDNYVWELVNSLYGFEHADKVVEFMNSNIIKELDGEYNDGLMNAYFLDSEYSNAICINIPTSQHLIKWQEKVKMYIVKEEE